MSMSAVVKLAQIYAVFVLPFSRQAQKRLNLSSELVSPAIALTFIAGFWLSFSFIRDFCLPAHPQQPKFAVTTPVKTP